MAKTLEVLEDQIETKARKQAIEEMDKRFGELRFMIDSGYQLQIVFGHGYYSPPEFMVTLFQNLMNHFRDELIKRLISGAGVV